MSSHAERTEQVLIEKAAEALAGDRLHHQSDDVDGQAVVPDRAGLIQQRRGRELFQEGAGVEGGTRGVGRGRIECVHRGGASPAIGEARGVAHQVQHGDRALGRNGLDRAVSGKNALVQHGHAAVAELRQEALDRVGETQAACFPQQQPGHAGDRLGHRGDGEQSVARHRGALVGAEMADGLVEDQTAVARNGDDGAGELAGLDLGVQRGDDAGEAGGGDTDGFGGGGRERARCGFPRR